jgi:hypothetical protein
MQKVGGREFGRLAFEQFFGPPQVDAVTLTLMQKAASVEDLALFKVAQQVASNDPMRFYEELGGGFKTAGSIDRAKGFKRVGELLSGSRAKQLESAKDEAGQLAGHHMLGALRHKVQPAQTENVKKFIHGHGGFGSSKNPLSKTPPSEMRETYEHARHVHHNKVQATRADRLGKVLSAEKSKVMTARGGAAGAAAGVVAGGVVAAKHKNSDK